MFDRRHVAVERLHAQRPRLPAQGLHQRVAVEPAFAAPPPGAGRDAIGCDIGEARFQFRRIEMQDIGAHLRLQGVIAQKRRRAGLGGEEQVAALVEPNVRPLAVDLQKLAD